MNAYIIEMPSFKYESLVRKVHTEIINFLFNLIRWRPIKIAKKSETELIIVKHYLMYVESTKTVKVVKPEKIQTAPR